MLLPLGRCANSECAESSRKVRGRSRASVVLILDMEAAQGLLQGRSRARVVPILDMEAPQGLLWGR